MKRLFGVVGIAFIFFLVVGLLLEVRTGYFSGLLRPVTVAVLDTGVDVRIPAIAARLAAKAPLNLLDSSSDVSDSDGHGTNVALLVAQGCGASGCRILPMKISKSGSAVTPKDLVVAIRYAVGAGARVINISSGLTQGNSELEATVADAKAHGVVIVTAAGTGIANPFRPTALAEVYPQSYQDVLVVGAAKSLDEPDPLMNFGDALDAVVVGQAEESFGSSFAAATVSGAVAEILKSVPKSTVEQIRAMLRHSTLGPKSLVTAPLAQVTARVGFGSYDGEAFRHEALRLFRENYLTRLFHSTDGTFSVELSAADEVTALLASWDCPTQPATDLFQVEAVVLKKGRGRISLQPGPSKGADADSARVVMLKNCTLKIGVTHPNGRVGSVSVSLKSEGP